MKNILVTIDFNGKEQQVLNKAFDMAVAFKSKLWIMHIAAPDPDFVGYGVGPQEVRDSRAKELKIEHEKLQDYASKMKARHVDAGGLLVEGATIKTIITEAEKLNADMIISGHENHGFFYKAILGSTAKQLIEASTIPVLIVPIKD
ncbi:universal stress protein [Formosa sediminum]|uniref:Universal stress protein n=1 Tax=Formosa sediminum TaxID=2594004 RepID=A0A516GM74_9FLAO|nr:universal stress protein [Formosa sediminum]QDO92619.1 universal stress protein [Formosa sediminum]